MKKNKLLLVIDVQNDFCAKNGKFDKIHEPIDKIKKALPNVESAIECARKRGDKIVFTKSLQVFKDLPKNMQERMRKHKRQKNYLVPNSWGADFFRIKPLKNENKAV